MKANSSLHKNQEGQIVVEYVLLLVMAVTMALIISTTMVGRNEDEPGFLISKWNALIRVVAQDQSDDTQ